MRREVRSLDPRFVASAASVIRRWDDGREAEPAHGLFLRIAAHNHQVSARKFAEAMGVNGRYLFPNECRQILSDVPVRNWGEIDRWTPRFDGNHGFLAGQRFLKSQWTLETRRFCPACLAQSAHHRTWWDLTFMTRCPRHGLDLTDVDVHGRTVRWWYPVIDRMPDGERLDRASDVPSIESPSNTWETYVLGRLGLVPAFFVDGLDHSHVANQNARTNYPLPLDLCVDAVGLLGRMKLGGWRRRAPKVGAGGLPVRDVFEAGFSTLLGGRPAIEKLIESIVDGSPADAFGSAELLGWSYESISYGDRAALAMIVDPMLKAIERDGRHGRSFGGVAGRGSRRVRLGIQDVASALGRSERQTKNILAARDIGFLRKGAGPSITLDSGVVQALVEERCDALSWAEAMAVLGISDRGLGELLTAGLLKANEGVWQTDDKRATFSRRAVEKLLRSTLAHAVSDEAESVLAFPLFSVAEGVGVDLATIIRDMRSGVIADVGRLAGTKDLAGVVVHSSSLPLTHPLMRALRAPAGVCRTPLPDGHMIKAEACKFLGVTLRTVQALVLTNFIKSALGAPAGQRQPLSEASVRSFGRTHATASLYAKVLDCRPDQVTKRLRALGVSDILAHHDHGLGKTVALFSREEVRRALGLQSDPDPPDGLYPAFWQGLDDYLREAGSTFRMARQDGSWVRLRSLCHKWRAEIEVTDRGVVVTTLVDKKSARRVADTRARFSEAQRRDAVRCASASRKAALLNMHPVKPRLTVSTDGSDWRFSVNRISLSGRPEVLLTHFRPLLYRLLLLSVERERAFFSAVGSDGGGLPRVSF